MRFDVLTLFPQMPEGFFNGSILKKARDKGLIEINCVDIRTYTLDKHKRVDDSPFGGGYGMVMSCQPAVDCIRAIKNSCPRRDKTRVIYLSPQGKLFDQRKAEELLKYDNLILFCGHYEGIDERIIQLEIDEEISAGNYILTGGELPAAIIVDAVSRLIEGVLPSPECHEKESLQNGLLEQPQYTRPRVFEGLEVPEVLINGNHAEQERWRNAQMRERTMAKRPELLEKPDGGGNEQDRNK